MPIIDGLKMACSPCIRGHRSTSCKHFNERVMVPVRKPGRPLSSCPCPPGKPCGCGGLKVAIPRKQKCGCGPGTGSQTNSTPSEQSPTTSPRQASFRVSKKSNGRKQSFDPSNLSRVDPASVNVVTPGGTSLETNALAMLSNGIPVPLPQAAHPLIFDGVGFSPAPPGAFVVPPPLMYATPVPYYTIQHGSPPGIKTEDNHAPQTVELRTVMPPPPYVNGGGHNQSSSLNGQGVLLGLDPSPIPKQNGSAPAVSSCCGGGGGGEANGLPTSTTEFTQHYAPDVELKPGLESTFEYPTIVTYPPDYGSLYHPVDRGMYQQVASQPVVANAPQATSPANGTPGELGTSYKCTCGKDCKCLGCLVHPYNETMLEYVNNAYAESNGSRSGSATHGLSGGEIATSTPQGHPTAPESPPDAQTPSEGSAPGEEQWLSDANYFFVNLPLQSDGSCGGNIMSCPCGDDCECIGCLVHNAPPVAPE
ncbi:hypothetical protein QBC47DRAFT_113820 [Echria macrotheca]|uniref:Copper-fist domain-containing protein n=1 Tax=Echria macrotheca TaxID=438768 RepID=A0AAJ0BK45_9PEZI|nr:hypothetical protein QBC47DRAFT_113820 [Echria macrotheca]